MAGAEKDAGAVLRRIGLVVFLLLPCFYPAALWVQGMSGNHQHVDIFLALGNGFCLGPLVFYVGWHLISYVPAGRFKIICYLLMVMTPVAGFLGAPPRDDCLDDLPEYEGSLTP